MLPLRTHGCKHIACLFRLARTLGGRCTREDPARVVDEQLVDDFARDTEVLLPDDAVREAIVAFVTLKSRQLGDVTTLANAEVVEQIRDMAETGVGEE